MKKDQNTKPSGNKLFNPSNLMIGFLMVTLVGSAVGGSFT